MDYPKSVPGVGLVDGQFVNEDPVTGQVGSLIPAEWGNSLMTELFSVFEEAGLDPDENDHTQLLQALQKLSVYVVPTAPSVNIGPIIYALDRLQILSWQTIGSFEGYASAEVGKFTWGTSISPRPSEENLIGQTIDRSLPKYAALIAWADVNGHMVASGSWVKGAFHFSSLGGNNVRLPDLRDMFIRATGTDLDTANARALGSSQADALQKINGSFRGVNTSELPGPQGAFAVAAASSLIYQGGSGYRAEQYTFDSSRVARASSETRGPNTAMHPTICL